MNAVVEKALRALAEAGIGGSASAPPEKATTQTSFRPHGRNDGGTVATAAGEEGGAVKVGAEEGKSFEERPRPGEVLPEHPRTSGAIEPKEAQGTAEPNRYQNIASLPDAVLTARYPLAEVCRATLDSNPAASKLSGDERRWIAEHLERAILNWLRLCFEPESAWDATCPKGHRITEGIFVKTLAGWCCEKCKQVYPTAECKLITNRALRGGV